MKVAKVMSFQHLNDEEFADLIAVPTGLALSIVKQLRKSASSGTAEDGSKRLSFWDIITYMEMLLSYKSTACKHLIDAGFLTFARDVLRSKFRTADAEDQEGEGDDEEENEEEEEVYNIDEADLLCLLKCVRNMAYFKAGTYGIVSKHDLFPSKSGSTRKNSHILHILCTLLLHK